MFYTYNQKEMTYHKVIAASLKTVMLWTIISFVVGVVGRNIFFRSTPIPQKALVEYIKVTIPVIVERTPFTEKALMRKLKNANVRFPNVVLAQARHETNNYTSNVFKKCNNLFGMKESGSRPTTRVNVDKNGYAIYDNWEDSVIDYALLQARFITGPKTKLQYIEHISAKYAEDAEYMNFTKHLSAIYTAYGK